MSSAGKRRRPGRSQPPERLDFGKLPGYIGYRVRLAQSAIFRNLARKASRPAMTPGEFSLVSVVGRNPGVDSSTLIRTYGLDKATLSLTLKRLTRRGLVTVARREGDRRYVALELTAAGRGLLRRATRNIERQERLMNTVLVARERKQLLELLGRIQAVLEAD